MANVTNPGPGTKKETVYSGPPLQNNQRPVYNAPLPGMGGTVYNGPVPRTNGTVHPGPAPSVYNPRQGDAATASRSAAPKGAAFFFLIAGLSILNTLLVLGHAPFVMALGLAVTRLFGPDAPVANILFINVMAVGILVLLGVFVKHGSKAALLIGMLLYAGDTALFFIVGDAAVYAPSIIVHVLLLIGMFRAFTQMES